MENTIASLGRPVLLRQLGGGSSLEAAIARWQHEATTVEIEPSGAIQLFMTLIDGWNVCDRASNVRVSGGSIAVFSPTDGIRVSVGDADVLQIFVQQAYAEAVIDAALAFPPMFDLRDGRMQAIIFQILAGSLRRGPDDVLLVEEKLHDLALYIEKHANRHAGSSQASRPPARGGLSPAAIRRVQELIHAAVDEADSPSLRDMAGAARLSVTHFVRAFRQQTGFTPHKYLVSRRMDRAISLLRSPYISVGEVADKTGFSTAAHFVATFRTAIGVTPAAVREALAS